MKVRRKLVPLLVLFSLLVAACGAPSTSETTGTSGTAVSTAAASTASASTAAASTATESTAAASTAATSTTSADTEATTASGEAVEFRMAWWGSQDRHDRTIKVIDLFRQANPNVNITYEFAASNDYWTKITTQAAGGDLPCLIQQDYSRMAGLVANNLLMPLDEYVENGTIDTSNIDKLYLDSGRIDGKLYAISLGTNTQALVFDPALFEKAGVPLPSTDWTWDDFEQTITQLHEKLGIYGMSTNLHDWNVFSTWTKQHGETLYNAEGTALGYEDDQLFVDFFTMLKGWMDQGLMPDRAFEVAEGNPTIEENLIVKEQAAIAYLSSNQVVAITTAAGRTFQTGILPKPNVPNGTHGQQLKPSQFFSITSSCDQPETVAKFIDFFTNSIPANEILLAERGVPISSEVRTALEPLLSEGQKESFKVVSLIEQSPSPLDPPDPAGSQQVISDVYNVIKDEVLYGQTSPEDGAKQFREQANAILAQNQK